jgi:glutamyl-tRNA reductase
LVMTQRRGRGGRALLLIDIAVPRDIDPRCADIEGVTLYDIDDLQAVVRRNLGARQEIVPQAEEIVEEEIKRFARWLGQTETLPTVAALREHGNEIVEQVLKENLGRWESASERDLMRVEAVARAVLNRLLHEPTIRLRSFSAERGHASLQLVRELFALDEEAPHEGLAHEGPAQDAAGKLAEVRSIESARKSQ